MVIPIPESRLDKAIDDVTYENDSSDTYLAMFDIDNFKMINDTYGHIQGDEVLRKIGEILLEESYNGAVSCRYGGEEFLLLIRNMDRQAAYKKNRTNPDQSQFKNFLWTGKETGNSKLWFYKV